MWNLAFWSHLGEYCVVSVGSFFQDPPSNIFSSSHIIQIHAFQNLNMIMFLCAVLLHFRDFISSYKRAHNFSILIVLEV